MTQDNEGNLLVPIAAKQPTSGTVDGDDDNDDVGGDGCVDGDF